MLTRKFGNSGPYIYNGQQIDMYCLSKWLSRYNRLNDTKVYPSQVTEEHIKQFLEDIKEELAKHKRDTALPASVDNTKSLEDYLG